MRIFIKIFALSLLLIFLSAFALQKGISGKPVFFKQDLQSEAELDSLANQVSYDSLYNVLSYLESQGIRNSGTGNVTLNIVRDYITAKLTAYGYHVEFQKVIYNGDQGYNIIVEKPGDGSTSKKIVIGGHYDSVPLGPGINDNGSGVAALLEVAKIMAERETKYPLILVWFTGEEHGFYGSRVYVDSLYSSGTDLLLMFNMDEIGGISNINGIPYTMTKIVCERDERSNGGTANNVPSYAYTDTLAMMTNTYSSIETVIDYAYGSDYIPFEEKGYVITGYYESVPEGNPYYHESTDILANMDVNYLEQVTRGAITFTAHIAGKAASADQYLDLSHTPDAEINRDSTPVYIGLSVVSNAPVSGKKLFYSVDNYDMTQIEMDLVNSYGITDLFIGAIDSLAMGDSLHYYFLFSNDSGITSRLPISGDFSVPLVSNQDPHLYLYHNPATEINPGETPLVIDVTVSSSTPLLDKELFYSVDLDEITQIEMDSINSLGDTVICRAQIDSLIPGDTFNYYFFFSNAFGNTTRLPDSGNFSVPFTAISGETPEFPVDFVIGEAYPNPFNPSTRIPYTVQSPGMMEIIIYNSAGLQLEKKRIFVGNAGKNYYFWDAHSYGSGTYYLRFRFNASADRVAKVVLIK